MRAMYHGHRPPPGPPGHLPTPQFGWPRPSRWWLLPLTIVVSVATVAVTAFSLVASGGGEMVAPITAVVALIAIAVVVGVIHDTARISDRGVRFGFRTLTWPEVLHFHTRVHQGGEAGSPARRTLWLIDRRGRRHRLGNFQVTAGSDAGAGMVAQVDQLNALLDEVFGYRALDLPIRLGADVRTWLKHLGIVLSCLWLAAMAALAALADDRPWVFAVSALGVLGALIAIGFIPTSLLRNARITSSEVRARGRRVPLTAVRQFHGLPEPRIELADGQVLRLCGEPHDLVIRMLNAYLNALHHGPC